jgi:hypothetical protein
MGGSYLEMAQRLLALATIVLVSLCPTINAIIRFGTPVPQHLDRVLHSLTRDILRTKLILLPDERPDFVIGEQIEFELFDDDIFIGDVTSFVMRSPTSASWFGNLRSSIDSSSTSPSDLSLLVEGEFELSCDEKACVANLNLFLTGDEYIIAPAEGSTLSSNGAGTYQISQYSSEKKKSGIATSAEGFVIDHSLHEKAATLKKMTSSGGISTQAVDTDLILDCFVMYTPEALTKIGGSVSAMKSKIYLASDSSNLILQRSGVSLRLRVVGIESADASFVEPNTGNGGNDFGTLLSWLNTPNDGNLDSALVYREVYAADLVLLVNKANAYAGLGYVNIGYNPNYAMANYNVDYVYGRVWMHEIGHILGCFHDRFSAALYSDPTYIAYGNCWEDTSKNDCTCYSSVMVYDCNTIPNGCTSCSGRDFLSNKNIYDAGSPTGEELASCGLHIHNKRMLGIAYRDSIQPGGILSSVTPVQVVNASCFTVTISGWQLGTGSDINSVTLDGISAEIVSQTIDSVVVRSPITSHISSSPGSVIVSTSAGRVTTLAGIFSFIGTKATDVTNFDRAELSGTSWESTGTLPWSFYSESSGYSLLKDGGSYSESAYAELTSNFLSATDPADAGCSSSPTSLSFTYWANSAYPQCYGPNYSYKAFSVWTRTSLTGTWVQLANVAGGSVPSSTTYTSLSYALPTGTIQIKFLAETCSVSSCASCRWWAPVRFDSINVAQTIVCTPPAVCLSTDPPTLTPYPTRSPTLAPSSQPSLTPTKSPTGSPSMSPSSRPTAPTFSPSFVPSRQPTSPTPSPTRIPSAQPTVTPTLLPSAQPTLAPSSSPSYLPSTLPTIVPSQTPTNVPSPVPPTQSPSVQPSIAPSRSPTTPTSFPSLVPTLTPTLTRNPTTPTIAPSVLPTLSPSLSPSLTPTTPTLIPSSLPTLTPTTLPSRSPTSSPSVAPSLVPTLIPSSLPSLVPTTSPSNSPTSSPSNGPTFLPTLAPSSSPTLLPVLLPSSLPTFAPSFAPSCPTSSPTESPTIIPPLDPTTVPTPSPSFSPSSAPVLSSTNSPSKSPAYVAPEVCESGDRSYCNYRGVCSSDKTSCVCDDYLHYWPSEQCAAWHPGRELESGDYCYPNEVDYYCSWLGTCNSDGGACNCVDPDHRSSSDRCSSWSPVPPPSTGDGNCVPGDRASCNNRGHCDDLGVDCVCDDPLHFWESEKCAIEHFGPQLEAGQCCTPGATDYYCAWMGVCSGDGSACACYDSGHRLPAERCQIWHQNISDPSLPTPSPGACPPDIVHFTSSPSTSPTHAPPTTATDLPTVQPSTSSPSRSPTVTPTSPPSRQPSSLPSRSPTIVPSSSPTFPPSSFPTLSPSSSPTKSPTSLPTDGPTSFPTVGPTSFPTKSPTLLPTSHPTVLNGVCVSGNRDYCNNRGTCNSAGSGCNCDDPSHYWPSEQCSVWHPGRELTVGQYCFPGVVDYYCSWLGTCNAGASACNCFDPDHRSSSDRCLSWTPAAAVPKHDDGTCTAGDRGYCHNHGACNPTGDGCVCDDPTHYWTSERCKIDHYGAELATDECCVPNGNDYYCGWLGTCDVVGRHCVCDDSAHRLPSERCSVYHDILPNVTVDPSSCPALLDLSSDSNTRSNSGSSKEDKYPYAWPYWTAAIAFVLIASLAYIVYNAHIPTVGTTSRSYEMKSSSSRFSSVNDVDEEGGVAIVVPPPQEPDRATFHMLNPLDDLTHI